jgi:hypothetical protein
MYYLSKLLNDGVVKLFICIVAAKFLSLRRTLVRRNNRTIPNEVAVQFFDGLIGLGTNPAPQFGKTFSKTFSTQGEKQANEILQ